MSKKVICLSLLLIFLFLVGTSFSTIISMSDAQASANYSPTETPDLESTPSPLQHNLARLNIDLSCDTLCFNNFVVGKTVMPLVYEYVEDNFQGSRDALNNHFTPNNNIGGGLGSIHFFAFSDDTQSIPLLNAWVVSLPVRLPYEENITYSLSDEEIDAWLPVGVIEYYGFPSAIYVTRFEDYSQWYTLILDYPARNIAFQYYDVTYDEGNLSDNSLFEFCPMYSVLKANIWSYNKTANEDTHTLIQRLSMRVGSQLLVGGNLRFTTYHIDAYAQITELSEQLVQTGCIQLMVNE